MGRVRLRRYSRRERRLQASRILTAATRAQASNSNQFSTGWGPPVEKTCCLKGITTMDTGSMTEMDYSYGSKFHLHWFLGLCSEHWPRWLQEVEEQRAIALAAVSRKPSSETIDWLMGLERLHPQMVEVNVFSMQAVKYTYRSMTG